MGSFLQTQHPRDGRAIGWDGPHDDIHRSEPPSRLHVSLTHAFAGLASQVLPGVIAGALRVFPEPDRAVGVLNTYALKLAFPALVVVNLQDPSFSWPTEPGFWLIVPSSLLLLLGAVAALRRLPGWRPHAGTMAMTGMFGNVAYIGLPLGESVLGSALRGQLTLLVAIHVTFTLLWGPLSLVRWSGGAADPAVLRRVFTQPIVWSPFVGLAIRVLPAAIAAPITAFLTPLAITAGPVVLFMIGLYVHGQVPALRQVDRVAAAHVAGKLLLLPLLTTLLLAGFLAAGLVSVDTARMAFLLSAMPTGAATFALAKDLGIGETRIAQAVVASTVVSILTLPVAAWIVQHAV